MAPHLLPADLAASWPEKTDLVLQLHLHPSGKPEVEQSVLGIHLTDQKPGARLQMNVFSNNKIDIAPGEPDYEVRTSRTLNTETDHLRGLPAHAPDRPLRPGRGHAAGRDQGPLDLDHRLGLQLAVLLPVRRPGPPPGQTHLIYGISAQNPLEIPLIP